MVAPALFDNSLLFKKLPIIEGPAARVLQLTRDDKASISEIAHAVKPDPTLVARLVKLANASRPSSGRPILAVQEAISVLGMTALRGLALGFSLIDNNRSGKCAGFNYQAFWSKNLARAVSMKGIAGLVRVMPKDDAFSLGLLSSMGELGLATAYPAEYSEIILTEPDSTASRIELEASILEIDHVELTVLMLKDWAFPDLLVDPVRSLGKSSFADYPAGSREGRILQILQLSDLIASICVATEHVRRERMPDFLFLGSKLGITPEVLTDVANQLVSEWQDWCRFLSFQSSALPPIEDLMKASEAPLATGFEGVPAIADSAKLRILVVDDERSMRGLLRALIEHIGHECIEAENGRVGLEHALKSHPDMIITDWTMPEMGGVEMIKRLRETEVGSAIYILILTVMSQEDNLVEAFVAGADDFLTKPLKPKILAARLRAGQRVINLLRQIERDNEGLRRFATEFARLSNHLVESHHTEPLTGLPGRHSALEWLRIREGCFGDEVPLGVFLVALDGLDTINRNCGRREGDRAVQHAAKLIQDHLNQPDKLLRVRYSDTCFMLICTAPTDENLQARIDNIRQCVESRAIDVRGNKLLLRTAYALRNAQTRTSDELLNAAEVALQQDKYGASHD